MPKQAKIYIKLLLFLILFSCEKERVNPLFLRDLTKINLVKPDFEHKRYIKPFCENVGKIAFKVLANNTKSSNFQFSPLSLCLGFSMLYNATEDSTKSEFMQLFGFHEDPLNLDLACFFECQNYKKSPLKVYVKIGVKQKQLQASDKLQYLLHRYFGTKLYELNFKEKASIEALNKQVEEKTEGHIPNFIEKDELKEEMNMILLNAVAFQGRYLKNFEEYHFGSFHSSDSTRTYSQYMISKKQDFDYLESDFFSMIDLELKNDFNLSIFLPKEYDDMQELVESLNYDYYLERLEDMKPKHLDYLKIPVLDLDLGLNLKQILISMGMVKTFDKTVAHFPELKAKDSPALDQIYHKTSLNILKNPEASTEHKIARSLFLKKKLGLKHFIVDKPFLYIFRHKKSNCIALIGKISNP